MSDAVNKPTKEDVENVEELERMMRMKCLIDRYRRNEPAGVDAAHIIQQEAEKSANQLLNLLWRLGEENRDGFAQTMGWPTANALSQFLAKGVASGTVN